MKKQKDLKVNSPQWVAAWKKMLENGFVMRCIIEQELHSLRFWMESFLVISGEILYRIRFERFLGDTIAPPKVYAGTYGDSVEALLTGLENFWVGWGMHNYLTIPRLVLAEPHRGFIRSLGSTGVVLLPTNHPVLMANYGAVREWAYQAKRGFVKSSNNGFAKDQRLEQALWQVFEIRFKSFLYQQQMSLLKNTIGEVISAEHG